MHQGPIDRISYLERQEPLCFARMAWIDPLSVDDYRRSRRLCGLRSRGGNDGRSDRAAVTESGLRGRGGAACSHGIKWKTVLDAGGHQYIVCNTDEGDSGTFSDRMQMEATASG